jgi:KDO2-lipid IV(A) lauroyltransferase
MRRFGRWRVGGAFDSSETDAGPVASSTVRAPIHPALARLEYGAFRVVAWLIRALPLDAASALSGFIWSAIAPFLRRHRRALANLEASLPELSAAEREDIARGMWRMLGRTFAEAFQLDRVFADPDRVRLDLSPEIQALFAQPKAVVLAGCHLGNWEIAALAGARAGLKIAGVYQRLKNPLVDDYVTGLRAPWYPAGLFSKGQDAVRKLMRLARQGACVALLADQRDFRGVSVPFFGRQAPSTPFPAMLARIHDLPIVAARVRRLKGARFLIDAEIIPVARTGDRDADIKVATAAIQACFERWIRQQPDQWMWVHRRWG